MKLRGYQSCCWKCWELARWSMARYWKYRCL